MKTTLAFVRGEYIYCNKSDHIVVNRKKANLLRNGFKKNVQGKCMPYY